MNRTLTIIYFKDNAGKARTLELPLKRVMLLLGGLSVLILLSIASLVFSVKFYIEKDRLAAELASISIEKEAMGKRFKDMEARISTLETTASQAEKPQVSKTDSPVPPATEKTVVSIALNTFKVTNEDNQITVSFDLMNTSGNNTLVQGYIFIIGDYGETSISIPEGVEIKGGMPVDFKKGNRFVIKWQKHVEQTFSSSENNIIKRVIALVYSTDGELLVKEEVDL